MSRHLSQGLIIAAAGSYVVELRPVLVESEQVIVQVQANGRPVRSASDIISSLHPVRFG